MRIGLLSDTHIPEAALKLPSELAEAFRGVDLILHAGDIYSLSVLDDLEQIAPVLAAKGDDDYAVVLPNNRVKNKHILRLEQKCIWLVHESPFPNEIARSRKTEEFPDIVVFGHEHKTVLHYAEDILYINPGSPTFLHYCRGLGTVGILTIDSGKVDARIVWLNENHSTSLNSH